GALGSFATVYLAPGVDRTDAMWRIGDLDGIELVLDNAEAAARFELPADRIGDLVVVARRDTAVGTREREHDLSGLTVPLRS
ncbi:phosphonoacetate hydrolase, partial [Paraburkholderia sp. SIMBA_049]